ncbi:hypothetical protein [Tritonibacter mobilis]|uniref:hypothetical protein n=1 Tax=Tritonibacter mobilis TaxID=379347 RepID=UPI000E0D9E8D|nr:hypothetical protein [Tritonibacter mobilis]
MMASIKTLLKMSNSTERAKLVATWGESLTDDQGDAFWTVVSEEWCGFDDIPYARFERLFARFRKARPDYLVAHLPIYIGELFRGQYPGHDGLSWTADISVAESFARGHRGKLVESPCIRMIHATRDLVAFTCDERDESEFVLFEIPTDDESVGSFLVT